MSLLKRHIIKTCTLLLAVMLSFAPSKAGAQTTGPNDTILVAAVVYNGDTIEAKTLSLVEILSKYTEATLARRAEWTRLRNAVFVTYPYALKAGAVMNDINAKLVNVNDNSERRKYIKSREKELKKEFTDPLTNLSVYQGRVLMKLINRETGNNCYEIIKEYKGGLTARFYQTVAFFFSTSLKQSYDAQGDDRQIEYYVQEVCRTYGYQYVPNPTLIRQGN